MTNSELHEHVLQKFREAFGRSHKASPSGEFWSVPHAGGLVPAKILLNGEPHGSSLWVFDPHAGEEGVFHDVIKQEGQVEALIERIRTQLSTPPKA